MSDQSLTVIMPSFNEEGIIEQAVDEVQKKVLNLVPGSNLIIVDGGSKDRTGIILDRLAQADTRITVLIEPGYPHGPSLIKGLNRAQGEFVLLIDSDMQIPLDCFAQMWKICGEHQLDAVFGIRAHRQDQKIRTIASAFIAHMLSIIFGVNLIDSNVPCKLLRRKIWQELYNKLADDDILAPSIFIAVYAKTHKYKVMDIPVVHKARVSGESCLNLNRYIRACIKGLSQVFRYRKILKH